MNAPSRAAAIGGTTAAIVVAFVVFTVVSVFTSFLIATGQAIFTVLRPGIIGFFAAIAGAVAGVSAARAACDAILRWYDPRFVFALFVALALAGFYYELAIEPMGWQRVAPLAQMVVAVAVAWDAFAKEPLPR